MRGFISLKSFSAIIFLLLVHNRSVHCNDAFEPDTFFELDDEPRTILYTAKPEVETISRPQPNPPTTEPDLRPALDYSTAVESPTETEPTAVCTPLQVLCQRIQETLETISNEIKQFQTKAMLEIAESERGQATNGCGLVQLMHTIEQLQRQQEAAKSQLNETTSLVGGRGS